MLHAARTSVHHSGARAPDAGKALPELRDLAGERFAAVSSGGGSVSAFDLLAGSKTITGLSMARFSTTHRELYDQHSEELWALTLAGRLEPAIYAEIPLADAARAHQIIESRANLGKVVLLSGQLVP